MPAPSAAAKIRRNMETPLVAGEADGVPRVVRRVVDCLDRREAGHTDEDDAEQDRRNAVTQRLEALVRNRNRPDQTGHIVLLRPPPEGTRGALSPAGLLARGSTSYPGLPGATRRSSGLSRRTRRSQLRGQPRLRARSHRVPFCIPLVRESTMPRL